MAAPRRKRMRLGAAGLAAVIALLALTQILRTRARLASPEHGPDSRTVPAAPMAVASASPPGEAADAAAVPFRLSEPASRQVLILEQILASKNDNDPRLDSDLLHLGEDAKAAFRAKYRSLPAEKHNERGTIVFLLGRNLTAVGDFAFLKEVLSEPPCLGIADCSRTTEASSGDKDHQSNAVAIVLVYPQLMALKAIQKAPLASASAELRDAAHAAIGAAQASRSPLVSQMAGP